jgi:CubicO group peptidase (beta-lactamase class C family)
MAELEQVVPAGSLWSYNNAGFAVAGRLIEVVTGMTYETALQELVLDPLELDESFFFANDIISRRFAVGHRVDPEQGPVVERPWALTRAAHAVGGLSSSVRDQLRYARFHLGDGRAGSGTRLLQPETLADMQRPHVRANLDRQMGLSWLLREIDGVMTVAHGGATNGQLSAFLVVPSRGFAITVLTNADEGSMLNDSVVTWALERYLGLEGAPPASTLALPEDLSSYLGDYDAALDRLTLYLDGDTLMAQSTPKGGFPDKHSPPGPTPPPSRLRFYEEDRVIALDPPMIHTRSEFLRDDQGRIAWLRTSRLHRKG